jgi:DNA-binding MarR family transcriptional regulator
MSSTELLPLSAFELALLTRINDNPATYNRALIKMFGDAKISESRISQVTRKMWEHGLVKRGKPYRAQARGGSPRIPLYLTVKGRDAVNAHAKVVFGLEDVCEKPGA